MKTIKEDNVTIGIIGAGRFGLLWADALASFAEIRVFDHKIHSEEELVAVVQSDLVFLCVPISAMEETCKTIASMLSPNTIVVDVCSVKVYPVEVMKKHLPEHQPIIATHPLFGPDSTARNGMPGQRIVVSPIRATDKQLEMLTSLCDNLSLQIIDASPEEHDKQMARSQALVHFIGRGLGPLELTDQVIATPFYRLLLDMTNMTESDTMQLFQDMQQYNPYTKELRKQLVENLQTIDSDLIG